jgi:hypothetical protein
MLFSLASLFIGCLIRPLCWQDTARCTPSQFL